MRFIPVKTRAMRPPKDDLFAVLDESLPKLREGDILLVTSKVVSVHQGRCVKITKGLNKDKLILNEAEKYIPRRRVPGRLALLTIKTHTLISSSGIDSSNGRGYYILWPKNPVKAAKAIWRYLRHKFKLINLGVIITDSHTVPLRRGTVGVALGFYGIEPLLDYTGKRSIFGAALRHTQVNLIDSLAAAAPLVIGESNEQTPLALIRGCQEAKFSSKDSYRDWLVPETEDLYAPLLKVFRKTLDKKHKTK